MSFTGSPSGKLRKPRAATVLARALPRRLELEVFELRAEHKASREAGLWRPFGFQSHSRLRRLVKTSRLRLTGVLQTLETKGSMRENPSSGVPAHTCAVGLYFMGCAVHSVPAQPHKTKPCPREHQERTASKSSPQGVTIPNADALCFNRKKAFLHNHLFSFEAPKD